MTYDPLPVAVRAWTRRVEKTKQASKSKKQTPRKKRAPIQRTIVFDTETTTDAAQQLNFAVCRYFIDRADALPGTTCVAEWIIYADNLPDRDPGGYETLQAYLATHVAATSSGRDSQIQLISRSQFVESLLFRLAYRQGATVAAFNLPFDLSRLAISATKSRRRKSKTDGAWKGSFEGNSLRLFERERARPRIVYKAIDSKRALISFTSFDNGGSSSPENKQRRGRSSTHTAGNFLDLRTLAFALTGKSGTLEATCGRFKINYSKRDVEHGKITEEYITYCREDVEATTALLGATHEELRRHPIDVRPTKALSPASVGKGYLKAMGVKPMLQRQPRFAPSIHAAAMEAYYGGRAECRIRKVPLPVVYVDFLSMYPTVHVLMDTWRLVTARRIVTKDVTREIRSMLASGDLAERCFSPEFWRSLVCLVQIIPDGDVVPVRARYDPASDAFNIGINPFHDDQAHWYSLPDIIASVIKTGRTPKVVRAIRLIPEGQQSGLRPIALRNAVTVDPRHDDFFKKVIELRKTTVSDLMDADDADRLDQFLKTLANSTGYGIYAEMTRHEEPDDVAVEVRLPDGESFIAMTSTPEEPENFCFPPLAAIITGAAKLMLALLEHEVSERGGAYVFCDTDSMAIVADAAGNAYNCPGGLARCSRGTVGVQALTTDVVDQIVKKFESLNPYDREIIPDSILKIEKENFDNGIRKQLWCYSISAKRYVLYRLRDESVEVLESSIELVKISEHGLGHLLNPSGDDEESGVWMWQMWEYILKRQLGLPAPEPAFLDQPALTKITASGPPVLRWFESLNEGRPYAEQIKPGNFFLIAQPDPLYPSKLPPFAPYEKDPSKWMDMPWFDRRTGQAIRISIDSLDGTVRPDTVRIRTFRDVLVEFEGHPEMKRLGPDGQPAGRRAVGLLKERPVQPLTRHLVGKEGNKIEERMEGLALEEEGYLNEYMNPMESLWASLVVPVLAMMNKSQLAHDAEVDRTTIQRYVKKGVTPRKVHEKVLIGLATNYARDLLASLGLEARGSDVAVLSQFLKSQER